MFIDDIIETFRTYEAQNADLAYQLECLQTQYDRVVEQNRQLQSEIHKLREETNVKDNG